VIGYQQPSRVAWLRCDDVLKSARSLMNFDYALLKVIHVGCRCGSNVDPQPWSA
jgi:hypothetical protein